MSTKPSDGSLAYLDEQIDALKQHTSVALDMFDPTGIHQARVATRRLKAGLDLFKPLLDKDDLKQIASAGKKLRRRLGPLRDLDVMIEHLREYHATPRLQPAVEWIIGQFEQMRQQARALDQKKGKKPQKLLEQFNDWWPIRYKLAAAAEAIPLLLTQSLHERFDRFSTDADWVAGIAKPSAESLPIDLHELRIDGKALRYTFELANAHGLKVRKSVFKSFKAMQESLGEWHDSVVLADETVKRWANVELALHDPDAAALVLDLAKQFLRDSVKSLTQFKSRWKRSGDTIRRALQQRLPLTRDVSQPAPAHEVNVIEEPIIELQTDPDPLPPIASERAQIPLPTDREDAEA